MKRVGVPDAISRGLYRGLSIREMVQRGGAGWRSLAPGHGRQRHTARLGRDSGIPAGVRHRLVLAGHFGLGERERQYRADGRFRAELRQIPTAHDRQGAERSCLCFASGGRSHCRRSSRSWRARVAHHSFHPGIVSVHRQSEGTRSVRPLRVPVLHKPAARDSAARGSSALHPAIRRFAVDKPLACAMAALLFSWLGSILVAALLRPGHSWILVPQAYLWLFAAGMVRRIQQDPSQKRSCSRPHSCALNLLSYGDWPGMGLAAAF